MPKQFIYSVSRATKSSPVTMSALDWKTMFGALQEGDLDEHDAYEVVAWVRRCVELRSNALSAIPCKIYRGQGDTEVEWEFADRLPRILWQTEASLQLYGAAYWLRERNRVRDIDYRWLAPSTIRPRYDADEGLTGFERRVDGKRIILKPDDVVYMWTPNLEAETGPGSGWVHTVLTESEIADAVNSFADAFFDRGAIPAVLLSVEGNPPRDELDRLEQWWRRLLQGVKRAWETAAIRATVKPVVIGYPTKDLAMPELMATVREQIAVAAGVPQTMLEDAANYATAREHHQAFYTETIVPEATWIEADLNQQLFEPLGLRIILDWESLAVFQRDEADRAQSLTHLTMAGVPLDMAMEMLGMDLPGDMTYDDFRTRLGEDSANAEASAQEERAELGRWQRKAIKGLDNGKGAGVDFDTDIIDPEWQSAIRELLALASTQEDVKAAFRGFLKQGQLVQPRGNPLRPVTDVTISEQDIATAFAEWDRLMPNEYAGLLDADVDEA